MIDNLRQFLNRNPLYPRGIPFLIFLSFTMMQGAFGDASRYWIYAAKTILGMGLIWLVYPLVSEARWRLSWMAVVTGVMVFVMWVAVGTIVPSVTEILGSIRGIPPKPESIWNPHEAFGRQSAWAWFFVVVRLLGSTFVVPPLEEAFYRSAVYRAIASPDASAWSLNRFHWGSFLITSMFFGLSHREWLAGILCGMAYQYLVLRYNRLGEAMTAHAITNFLLGLWVIFRPAWQFW